MAGAKSSLGGCQRWDLKVRSALQGACECRSAINDALGTLVLHVCPPNPSQSNLDQVSVQHFCLIYLFKSRGRSRCLYSGLHPQQNPRSVRQGLVQNVPREPSCQLVYTRITGAKTEESEQTCR